MKKILLAGLALVSLCGSAWAQEPGDWLFRAGPYVVAPKSDNSDLVSVDDGTSLGFNITYFFSETWAFEVLAALPFSHDVKLAGGPKVAEVKHLPPTFSFQYHFPTGNSFKPYVGLGLNYTTFFDESTTGPLEGTSLKLDDSFGLAAQLGADFNLNERWSIGVEARWINIEADAELDGVPLTKVEIDPLVYNVTLGYRF